jgi:hypothetical protein
MGNSMQPNGLGPLNTTSFLFDDNDDKHLSLNGTSDLSSPFAKAFMQLGGDDKFPTLRSNGTSGIVSSTLGAPTKSSPLTSTSALCQLSCFGFGQFTNS